MRRLWVVEMVIGHENGKQMWGPTVGVGLTRQQARDAMNEWCDDNPNDSFRVREYWPYEALPQPERE